MARSNILRHYRAHPARPMIFNWVPASMISLVTRLPERIVVHRTLNNLHQFLRRQRKFHI